MTDITPAKHAAESGHWYDPKTNTMVESVKGEKGQDVKPNVGHARKLGLVPGVTSVIRIIDKWAVNRWRVDQGILVALTLTRAPGETDEAFLERVHEDIELQSGRDRGTAAHAEIQSHYDGKVPSEAWQPLVSNVTTTIGNTFGSRVWLAEKVVTHPLGYGTKADVHDHEVVLDIKSKDLPKGRSVFTEKLYDEHYMQLAATRRALAYRGCCAEDAHCAIVMADVATRAVCVVSVDEKKLDRGLRLFDAALKLWQIKNNMEARP